MTSRAARGTRRAARGWWWVGTLLGACQPNWGGVGTSAANTLGLPDDTGASTTGATDTLSSTGEPTTTTADPSETVGATTAMVDTTTGEPPPVTTGDPAPLLSLSDGPTYDFGDVDLAGEGAHVFTLTNVGDAEAVGLDGTVAAPFALPGGFPGIVGDCGASLAAGDSCTIEVTFAPTVLGRHVATLTVTHDAGPDVTRTVEGGAIGQTETLLVNPGGETPGAPPPGWTEGVGAWEANVPPLEVAPHEGERSLGAGAGPNNESLSLRQDVDMTPWATTSDQGRLRVSFAGWARAYVADDDEHRIRVRYLDDRGRPLHVWTSNYESQPAWQQYTHERLAPAGTRTVQVELNCRKDSETDCHAYFDALELRASYP